MKIGIISGASSGIGREIARELDACGIEELWLIGRDENKLLELMQELKTSSRVFVLDLTKEESIEAIKNELSSQDYRIEFLVLSAGVGYTGTVENNTPGQISNMIDLNCKALTLIINVALPFIVNGGQIINIASGAGFVPQADFAVYAASKAYVISLSKALRKELKERKINVCAVCPGPVDTDFFSGLENVKEYKKKYLITPARVARGAVKASLKKKAIYSPTFPVRLLHLGAKILPTSLIMKFSK